MRTLGEEAESGMVTRVGKPIFECVDVEVDVAASGKKFEKSRKAPSSGENYFRAHGVVPSSIR